jgi:hypothetical protein
MCYQDVLLGAATDVGERAVTITNSGTDSLVGGDPRRSLLIIGPPDTGEVWLSTSNSPAVGVGFHINANDPPLVLDVQTYGQLVRKGWSAVSSVAASKLSVYEGAIDLERFRASGGKL